MTYQQLDPKTISALIALGEFAEVSTPVSIESSVLPELLSRQYVVKLGNNTRLTELGLTMSRLHKKWRELEVDRIEAKRAKLKARKS